MNIPFITSYERDNETELDYAQARYYSKNHGRFNSADPLLSSGISVNPKTWNRYSYVLNNPLKLIDPTGLISIDHELLHSNEGNSKKPKVTIVRKDTFGKPNIVSGNVNEAIERANKSIDGKYAGKVNSKLSVRGTATKKGQYFSWSASAPDRNGNSQVNATLSDIIITATTVTTLPEWDGYDSDSTSAEDKKTWDDFLTGLKAHEEGHVEINKQEAENLKADIEAALPGTSTVRFTSKQSSAGSESERRLNFRQVDSAVQTGLQRHSNRQLNYDKVSNHRLSPAQLKEQGIDY